MVHMCSDIDMAKHWVFVGNSSASIKFMQYDMIVIHAMAELLMLICGNLEMEVDNILLECYTSLVVTKLNRKQGRGCIFYK